MHHLSHGSEVVVSQLLVAVNIQVKRVASSRITGNRPGMHGPYYVVSIVLALKFGDYTQIIPFHCITRRMASVGAANGSVGRP